MGMLGETLHWDGTQWNWWTEGTFASFYAVGGTDEQHVWAVGSGGTIVRRSGRAWVSEPPVGTSDPLYGLWVHNASDIWAVGGPQVGASDVVHYDGSTWSLSSPGNFNQLYAVWGADDSHVWAVGHYGQISFWNGATWTTQASGLTNWELMAVWGTDADHVWAVGQGATVLYWDGTSWSQQIAGGFNTTLTGIWGTDPSHVWASGQGYVTYWDGTSWTYTVVPIAYGGIWGTDANHIWVAGYAGGTPGYAQWDGTSWTQQSAGEDSELNAVWGSGGHLWFVGNYGTIVYRP